MKKKVPTQNHEAAMLELLHNLFFEARDAVEKHELHSFINPTTNEVDIRALEEDDDIEVSDVLVIGGYLALNKLHDDIHKMQADKVLSGEIDIKVAMPKDLPPELADALQKVVDEIRKNDAPKRPRKKKEEK